MIWHQRLFGALAGFLSLAAAQPESVILIRGAHVFDGSAVEARPADVLIADDRITRVGRQLRAPRGARIINGRGMTLLPGLHDLHTHLRSPGSGGPDDLGKAYASELLHGITTAVDFSVSGEMIAPIRQMTGAHSVTAPNLALAVRIGVPGGHGTERGWGELFTMEAPTPRAANLVMDRVLPYRPDVIKVFADGWRYGRVPDINSMDLPTLRAIVERAHEAGVPVITHTVSLAGARIAAAAGVDAIGHGIGDALVDEALIASMRSNQVAYVPTMAVYEPQRERDLLTVELQWLAPDERAREAALSASPRAPTPELEIRRWRFLQENLRRLKAAGVRIGIGTDSGIGGVYHGSSTLREIRLFERLGFSLPEALAAATSVSAQIVRQSATRGRIAPGQRADLIIVGGRPDQRVDDLYNLRQVIVGGREIPLTPLRRLVDAEDPSRLPAHRMTGPIATHLRSDGRTDLDTLMFTTFEPGLDHSHLDVALGATGPGRLFVLGRMGAAPEPRAALVVPLTAGPVQLADARGFAGISIAARGTGRYALQLDTYGLEGRSAFRVDFTAGSEMTEIRVPFESFHSPDSNAVLDLARLRALIVQLAGEPGGTVWLELGAINFYRRD